MRLFPVIAFILASLSAQSQKPVNNYQPAIGFEGRIQPGTKTSTANYHNTVFTIGAGYVWKFHKNFYLTPWGAMPLNVTGDNGVPMGDMESVHHLSRRNFDQK